MSCIFQVLLLFCIFFLLQFYVNSDIAQVKYFHIIFFRENMQMAYLQKSSLFSQLSNWAMCRIWESYSIVINSYNLIESIWWSEFSSSSLCVWFYNSSWYIITPLNFYFTIQSPHIIYSSYMNQKQPRPFRVFP